MSFSFSALTKSLFRRFAKACAHAAAPRTNRARLFVTALEDRTVPTAVVTVAGSDVYEGGGSGSFVLTRTDTTGGLSINGSWGGGTASAMEHTTPLMIYFDPGSATTTVNVTAFNDTDSGPTETIVFTLSSGSGYTIGT